MRMADLGGDLLEVVIRRCTDSRCMHYAKRRGSPAGSVVKRRMTRTGLRRRPLTLHVDGTAPGERRKTSRCDGGRYPRPAIGQTRGSCGTCSAHAVFIGKGGHSGGRAPELFSSSAVSTGGSRYARRLRLGERGKDGKTPVGAGDVAGLRRSRQMLICAACGATGRVTMRTPRDTRGMRVGRNMPAADDGVSVWTAAEKQDEVGRIAPDIGPVLPGGLGEAGVRPADEVLCETGACATAKDVPRSAAGAAPVKHRRLAWGREKGTGAARRSPANGLAGRAVSYADGVC